MALAPDTTLRDTYRITYVADDRPDSVVYRAMERSGRRVLIAALPHADDQGVEEARALARQVAALQIGGLLPLLDHFALDRTYYLVSEDPGGQDLERYARERGGPLPEAHVLAQMERLLQAIEALHGAKPPLFVGDLRSSDVWSNSAGELFLAPFALARPLGDVDMGYRAPELSAQHEEPDTASDMYSFGVLFYQLLTGWLPPGAAQREAGTPLSAPRALNPQVSALAEQAALRSLELKKGNRYQAAREMRQALETVHMMAGRSLGLTESLPASQPSFQPAPAVAAPVPVPPPPSYGPPQPQPQAPGYGTPQAPGYGTPQAPAYAAPQGYPQGYAPQPAPAPARQSNTCLVIVVVVLALVALAVCAALVVVILGPGRPLLNNLLSRIVPTATVVATSTPAEVEQPAAPTSAPAAQAATAPPQPTSAPAQLANPAAISLASVAAITQTRALTESLAGPVLYSPDGKTLALALGQVVTLRDSKTLNVLFTLRGHSGSLNTLAFSPDSTTLASGAIDDPQVRLWDVASGETRAVLSGHTGWVRSVAFSPDGKLLASASSDRTIRLWNISDGSALRTLEGHSDMVQRVAFSPDGKLLASTSRDGTVRLWDVTGGPPHTIFTAPNNTTGNPPADAGKPFWMTALAFSPDGTLVAAGSIDSSVRIWEVSSGALKQTLEGHTDWITLNSLAFSPDGKTLASGSLDGDVRLWDPASGAARGTLTGNRLQLLALAFHPDGTHLVTSSDDAGTVAIWNITTNKVEQSLHLGQGLITALSYSSDSAVLATGGVNGTVRLYELSSDRVRSLTGGAPTSQSLAFVSSSELAAVSDTGSVVLIDLAQDGQVRPLANLDAPAITVAATHDGSMIAVGSTNGSIGLWETASARRVKVLQGQQSGILALAFSPDGTLLAAGSGSGGPEVDIFDVRDGQLKHALKGHEAAITDVAFQPNGPLLATASRDGGLRLWNSESGALVGRVDAQPDQGWFTNVSFSPDGTLLVTGSLSGSLDFWNPGTGELLGSLDLASGGVLALSFRPDGEQIAASLKDSSVRLFEVAR